MSRMGLLRSVGRLAMFRSLSVRNYRLFASGQIVSLIGTWMALTTLDWLVVALGGGGHELGITLALQFTPMLVLGLYAGVVADRFDKRRLLVLTQSSAGLLSALLCLLIATDLVTIPVVYAFSVTLGIVNAFDTPTRQAFVSEMVGPALLPNAVALNSIVFNSARILGPVTAGGLIGALGTMPGAGLVFGLNALSFGGVITGLLRMRRAELYPARPVERARGQLRAGLAYAVRHRDIVMPVVIVGVVGAMGLNFPVTIALVASETFHGTAATYGMLTAMLAVGSVFGAALSARRTGPPNLRRLVVAAAAFGVAETALALMPTLWAFTLVAIPTGACVLLVTTTANATVQLAAAESMRGRVMALYLLVFLGTTPIGAPIVGAVSESFGPRAGLAVGGVSSLAVALLAAAVLLRWKGSPSSQPAGSTAAAAVADGRPAGAPAPQAQDHQAGDATPTGPGGDAAGRAGDLVTGRRP